MKLQWKIAAFCLVLIPTLYGVWLNVAFTWFAPTTIKVGILHAVTGPISAGQRPLVDAEMLAIADLNEQGGLLGRMIEPVIVDTKSSPATAAAMAERLITQDRVDMIFGLWLAFERKRVKEVIDQHDTLYIFPIANEGCELSDNIFYTGPSPSQYVVPALLWALNRLGKRVYFVGSDALFAAVSRVVCADYAKLYGGQVVGEYMMQAPTEDHSGLIEKIKQAKPDFVMNMLFGPPNTAFMRQMHQQLPQVPIMITQMSIAEIPRIGVENVAGHYLPGVIPENSKYQKFMKHYRDFYGSDSFISAGQENSYASMILWARQVQHAGDTSLAAIQKDLNSRVTVAMPQGALYIDPETQYCYRAARIGKVGGDGSIATVWSSEKPVKPHVYPPTRTREFWDNFLHKLFVSWGNRWIKE